MSKRAKALAEEEERLERERAEKEPPIIEASSQESPNANKENENNSELVSAVFASKEEIETTVESSHTSDVLVEESADVSATASADNVDNDVECDNILVIKADGEEDGGDEDDFEIIEPVYIQARSLFLNAEVHPAEEVELKWEECNEVELRKFLVERMCFNPERVTSGIAKLQAAFKKKSQKRMDR